LWRDDRRSAELLGDQSPQFAAGEKAGKRLPAPSNAADSLVIATWFRRRNRGGCIYVIQKEILCRSRPASSIVVGLPVTQPQWRARIHKRFNHEPAMAQISARSGIQAT
jgi:hypothetical protein